MINNQTKVTVKICRPGNLPTGAIEEFLMKRKIQELREEISKKKRRRVSKVSIPYSLFKLGLLLRACEIYQIKD
jgi:hypothetical protein